MTRVLCIANQKGGVGKTSSAVSLADGLAKAGERTLLVDLDPQCNSTTALGVEPIDTHPLVAGQPLSSAIISAASGHVHVLPGTRRFRDVEILAREDDEQTQRWRHQLRNGFTAYDFVLIDCPPSIGPLTQTALAGATEILMPIQCEYFAMEGLTRMIDVIRRVMTKYPGQLEFGGILLTMYDHALELTHEVDREVREFFGEIVYRTVIPRDVTIAEASSFGVSVLDYAPRSRGARAYIELCMEVLERV